MMLLFNAVETNTDNHPKFLTSPPTARIFAQLSVQLPASVTVPSWRLFKVLIPHSHHLLCDSSHPQLQMSSCMLSKISETLHQTKPALDTETQQRHQIQDQLCHANTEMENLQQELIYVHRTPEKKVICY